MKKLYLLPFLLLVFVTNVMAQTPEKLSYQAIIRNSSSDILANQSVGVQISILQNSANGSAVYVETQSPTTNANGLINLEIGTGTLISGTFNTINWGNNTYFIKTEIDPDGGSSYTITGTSQLLSVPYALHAKTAESISGGITESDPVFTASIANGISNSDISNWNNKLSAEVDGSVTNEIELPTGGTDGQVLKTDGSGNYTWADQTTDTDTQLDETQVDAFVANNSYLTSIPTNSVNGTNIALGSDAQGDIMYYDGTNWVRLPAGTTGQILQTNGSGANPSWVTPSEGGSSTSAVIKSSNYTIQAGENVIISNATSTITFTLPTAATAGSGAVLNLYGITNNFNISTSETIYDANGAAQTSLSGKFTAILVSDGINKWYQMK